MHLYHEQQCDAVLSDDGNILKWCKSRHIPHYNCLSLLYVLLQHEAIGREQVNLYFERMVQVGYYSDWVIRTARNMIVSVAP